MNLPNLWRLEFALFDLTLLQLALAIHNKMEVRKMDNLPQMLRPALAFFDLTLLRLQMS